MGISINSVTSNGTPVTYGRITDITMDFGTRETKVTIGGYFSKDSSTLGIRPIDVVLTGEFIMPDPTPENITKYAYEQLSIQYPDIDFTEI